MIIDDNDKEYFEKTKKMPDLTNPPHNDGRKEEETIIRRAEEE